MSILLESKGKKCIIAGIYHPDTIGFYSRAINHIQHYSWVVPANKIAFSKSEVIKNYQDEIKSAIQKLEKEGNKEVLIKEIKQIMHFPD